MGEVYRGRNTRLGREVAIKVLRTSFSSDPDRMRLFEQEAKAAGLLNQPNIVSVYDVGSHDGAPYPVEQAAGGRDAARLARLPETTRSSQCEYGL